MSGFLIKGKRVTVKGLDVQDRLNLLRPGKDFGARHVTWVRGISIRTSRNKPINVIEGIATERDMQSYPWWVSNPYEAGGAHVVVGVDGKVHCLADLLRDATYQAGPANEYTVGVELVQGNDGSVFRGQLDALLLTLDALTRELGIQRQINVSKGFPIRRLVQGGTDVVGIYESTDALGKVKGVLSPVFDFLGEAGYEKLDFFRGLDKVEWKNRQLWLNSRGANLEEDGVPAPSTVEALKRSGYTHGLWVSRPTDG